jgi:two-component system, NtrC family, response regulator AtoC
MAGEHILVVDDEALVRWTLREHLQAEGFRVSEADSRARALAAADADAPELVLLDVHLPDGDGADLLPRLRGEQGATPVIMITADGSVERAVAAIRAGAFHFLSKPLNLDEVTLLARNALESTRLRRELAALQADQARPYALNAILGESPAITAARQFLRKIATSPASTVLLTGESGTGKDLAAKVIHYNSGRSAKPFINITCSALPEALLESELFGHEKGAFTDAKQQKKGLLEQADDGTVFLDEIGEMSAPLQAKLLRFLEEKSFRRVGGSRDLSVDARVIAATNRDLKDEVAEGRFREDLFYRLNVMQLELPPLRDRTGDIPLLAQHFVQHFNREFRRNTRGVSPGALQGLELYPWPGNVREFRNVMERAMLLGEGELLERGDFPALQPVAAAPDGLSLPAGGVNLEQLERRFIVEALERTGGNQTRAAALLGMNRDQIRYRIEKYGLGNAGRET